MSKLVLIASVALHIAGRGAAADRAVDQIIKSKAAEAIARARAAGAAGVCAAEWAATVECLLREAAARAGQTCDTKGACAGASSDAAVSPALSLLVAAAAVVAAATF